MFLESVCMNATTSGDDDVGDLTREADSP